MAISVNRPLKDTNTKPETTGYTSNILKLFIEGLEDQPQKQVLDVGPACHENIIFFTRHVKRLYICDMFFHLMRCLSKKRPVSQIWKHLDYPSESFDGILLWELTDRLDEQEAVELVELCYKMLKPGGMVVVFVLGEQSVSSVVNTFVVGKDFRVHLRPQPHLHLPLSDRQNRDVLAMMAPFTPVKSYVCRHGLREFLFKRE